MQTIPLIAVVLALIIAIVIIAKTIHFLVCINRKKFKYWKYFATASIINSTSEQSRETKRLQNFLSISVLCLVLIELIVLMFYYKITKSS